MGGLKTIPRTATFTWSPGHAPPIIATGTKAGAVDEGFSNETQLELWKLDLDDAGKKHELAPAASIGSDSRFNDIAWTKDATSASRGIIAGALENGALDLWDADALLRGSAKASMSRTTKHSGAIKALQFNAFRSELLATVGVKGELFISDINNVANPFRMGNAVARADDFECLDWNKRTSHIMVTGSSGGTMTVWDIKNKRESLTLNNLGRKPVSAVAWDPVKTTRLVTAIPNDTDPVILVWDLRNANAPERVLKGHDGGVLSLSWCQQDSDLLLSCGKDNRTICWNPQTGESYGEYPVVTNWTFQTRWNPQNPGMIATASFDGKVSINSIQSTKTDADIQEKSQSQNVDDEDFFNKTQNHTQGTAFSLQQAPKWLQRPCGATFGFGGKVVSFKSSNQENNKRSMVRISSYVMDETVVSSTESFEKSLNDSDIGGICDTRIAESVDDAEKADWRVMKALTSENTRKELVDYLGFSNLIDEAADDISKLKVNGESKTAAITADGLEPSEPKNNRLSSFFDTTNDGDNFLSELAASKSAKTNSPFQMYTGSESESDRSITRALLLGDFDKALTVCLKENRMSDAFMIAICGGQTCIERAQKAYFNQKENGPNYLRLLASVVGKNLWDLVHNADLQNWKEVMATLCTYADTKSFPDLCEELGDRLEAQMHQGPSHASARKDAAFCYLAGSKLEKVVGIWLSELPTKEADAMDHSQKDSAFAIHSRALQSFIEKVTVFRQVTNYQDEQKDDASDWKLGALYDKYIEYAEIASAHGKLTIAERYLDLLPAKYAAAEVAKSRVKTATGKVPQHSVPKQSAAATRTPQRNPQSGLDFQQERQPIRSVPSAAPQVNPYAPNATRTQNPYAPMANQYNGGPTYGGYQQGQGPSQSGYQNNFQNGPPGPPPSNFSSAAPVPPPSKATNMGNWNDMPESFFKPSNPSRRATPSIPPAPQPQFQPMQPPPQQQLGPPPRSTPPVGPPPKAGSGPPPITSPQSSGPPSVPQIERPPSTNPYAPASNTLSVAQQATIPRGPSPYNAPPSAPPSSNRYAPTQQGASHNTAAQSSGSARQAPPVPNPYAPQQNMTASAPQSGPPPQAASAFKTTGPPPQEPLQKAPNASHGPVQSAVPFTPKHPSGDRTHISSSAKPIYDILNNDMQRIKARAPSSFKAQVNDTEKRLNILFDHLNNNDLLKPDTVSMMVELARAIEARNFDAAQAIHVEIMANKTDECGNWMVGVKRLILMSKATP